MGKIRKESKSIPFCCCRRSFKIKMSTKPFKENKRDTHLQKLPKPRIRVYVAGKQVVRRLVIVYIHSVQLKRRGLVLVV